MKAIPHSPFTKLDFQARRNTLVEQLKPNSICIIASATMSTRSNDTEYPFRQNSDFWYLTGFNEPNAWLVLSNLNGKRIQSSCVFVQPSDEFAEVWHGRRLGVEKAAEVLGVDDAFNTQELEQHLLDLIDGHEHLYYTHGSDKSNDSIVFDALAGCKKAPKQSKTAPTHVVDVNTLIHSMRMLKSEKEIEVMRTAGHISADAHVRAMQYAHAGCNEFELEAEIKHEFAMQGARNEAYHSIVGGGENACILHYTENNQIINDNELVLIDAGCELHGYAADITRTFPVNGRFTKPQKQLYQLVLDAQLAAISLLKPGATISQAMRAAVRIITQGLIDLNILNGNVEENIAAESWKQYFMHGLGHWLGLDVHDVGIYKIKGEDIPLKPGMVLTVEPGIYIANKAKVDSQYKGIGIRIEDDVLITQSGYEVLTNTVPKSIEQIESLMQARA